VRKRKVFFYADKLSIDFKFNLQVVKRVREEKKKNRIFFFSTRHRRQTTQNELAEKKNFCFSSLSLSLCVFLYCAATTVHTKRQKREKKKKVVICLEVSDFANTNINHISMRSHGLIHQFRFLSLSLSLYIYFFSQTKSMDSGLAQMKIS
jgi:hypothetical protein